MKDIKTKERQKTIKVLNRAEHATYSAKKVYISTKEHLEKKDETSEEYAQNTVERTMEETADKAVSSFVKAGRKSVEKTKENYKSAKTAIREFKRERYRKRIEKQIDDLKPKVVKTPARTIKGVDRNSRTVKTASKGTAKKTVKTAENTAKTVNATVRTSQKAFQKAKVIAKQNAVTVKNVAKATISAVKAIIAGTKALVSALIAGGWVAVAIIILLSLVGLIASSSFGIFFSGEDSGTGMAMKDAVRTINEEYYSKIESIKAEEAYDILEMRGSQAMWRDVLSVYAVKVSTDEFEPREVATVDDEKVDLLRDIFWEMNDVSYKTYEKTHTVVEEWVDKDGNIVVEKKVVTEVYLRITVSHKSPFEMAEVYDFNDEQMKYLTELLKDENRMLWANVLYGIKDYDQELIAVALSQVGNVGGMPYWSWYGFSSRVEWCACFVSWCANECGYIDSGIIPKFAGCGNGASWFQERGQWLDGNEEPLPGMIIFFDWESDGIYDHVGIVYKIEDGKIFTVEGNSSDECKMKQYDLGYTGIVGYGMPDY